MFDFLETAYKININKINGSIDDFVDSIIKAYQAKLISYTINYERNQNIQLDNMITQGDFRIYLPNAIFLIETKTINETSNYNLRDEKRQNVREQVVKFAHNTYNFCKTFKKETDIYAIILTDEEIKIMGKINKFGA